MTNVGDHVKCPQCGREARVVWVSQDEKTMAIRCKGNHSHDDYKAKPKKKTVKGMIFLTEVAKKE